MNTKKYLNALLDGAGHLNKFPVKTTENGPDYGGYIKIGNKTYRLSAWVVNAKLSMQAKECDIDGNIIKSNIQANSL